MIFVWVIDDVNSQDKANQSDAVGADVNVNVIRLLRIFKVIRLFGKMKSLQRIVKAISATIVPVIHTFFLFGIVSSIYAVLATSLFHEAYPERFGAWTTSSFTLFQAAPFLVASKSSVAHSCKLHSAYCLVFSSLL